MRNYTRLFLLALAAAYFIFATVVQYNDPDPLHWMALYGLTAVCCLAALGGRHWPWLLWMLAGMSISELLVAFDGFRFWLLSGQENLLGSAMSPEKPWIEQSREFFGAAINLAVVGYLLRRSKA